MVIMLLSKLLRFHAPVTRIIMNQQTNVHFFAVYVSHSIIPTCIYAWFQKVCLMNFWACSLTFRIENDFNETFQGFKLLYHNNIKETKELKLYFIPMLFILIVEKIQTQSYNNIMETQELTLYPLLLLLSLIAVVTCCRRH